MKNQRKNFAMQIPRPLLFTLLILTLGSIPSYAQKEEQLAAQYYENEEFDKAVVLYEELLTKNPASVYYYDNYLGSLLALKEYKEAEKMIKRQVKRFPNSYNYKVDVGYLYKLEGNVSDSKRQFDNTLKQSPSEPEDLNDLANAFLKREEWDYALQVYQKARRVLRNENAFSMELASLYGQKGDLASMYEEYLNALQNNNEYSEVVQNNIQNSVSNEKDFEVLKGLLLKRIQSSPDKTVYSEMLIWLFVQNKDFNGAFMQSRALDKRFKEGGFRIMELANLCISNEKYDAAEQCYQYIVGLGKSNSYYLQARLGLLEVKNKKILSSYASTQKDLLDLEGEYVNFLNEFGKSMVTATSMAELAHLYAYYLDKKPEAVSLLKEVIDIPRLNPQFHAQSKLALGDIYILIEDYWEASLMYSQVEKDFFEDPLGQEARFRNARLSYYKGEFEWSKGQLDVLKTATTQLISNNAIELSLLIQDNTGLDTTEVPMNMYSSAELLTFQNKFAEAMERLDSISILFSNHTLADEILLLKARIMMKKGDLVKASEFYERIIKDYSFDILADNALFELADLNENKLNDKTKAKELYEKLITEYPGSLFVVEARKRYRALRGDQVN
jgi:tetratricopeptide (TPR) repeat protein